VASASTPEVLLISAILNTQDSTTAVMAGVTPEMFYGFREEYEWLSKHIENHHRTPSKGAFRENFPELVLKKDVDDVELFAEEVKENHSRQLMLKGMKKAQDAIRAGDMKRASMLIHETSIEVEGSLLGGSFDSDIFTDFEDIEREVLARKKRMEETGFSGIPTGFPTLDELTGGIQPGWFVIVCARSGVGKTRSLTRMSCAAAFSGFTSQYDALEQSRAEIAMQVHAFASSEFGTETFKSLDLAQGKGYDEKGYRRFLRTISTRVQGKMHVADNRHVSIGPATINAQIKRNNPDIFFLDYLTLMEGADDWQSSANLVTALSQTAKRSGCAIVTAAQVNRKGAESKEIDLEHLSVTDRLGNDADLVVVIERFGNCRTVVRMKVIKFRHGPSGYTFFLKFDPNQGVMEEITYEQACDFRDMESAEEESKREERKFIPRKKGSFAETAKTRKTGEKASVRRVRAADDPEQPKTPRLPSRRPRATSKPVRRYQRESD
jgi:replicative DNA helicase